MMKKLSPAPKKYAKAVGPLVSSTQDVTMIRFSSTTNEEENDDRSVELLDRNDGTSVAVEEQRASAPVSLQERDPQT